MRRFILAFVLLGLGGFCLGGLNLPHFKTERALAQGLNLGLGIPESIPSGGGGSPTWTNQTEVENASCGFATVCTFTSVPVTSGLVVAAVGGINNAGTSSTVTTLVLCGTSLTLVASPSGAANGFLLGECYGTVTGGSCSAVATASAVNAWNDAAIVLGTLANLSSDTPGTSCNGTYAASQNAPYPCTSAITVPAGGFGIAAFGFGGAATLTSTNLTIDAQNTNVSLGIGHTTLSETPTFSGGNFLQAAIIAAPWR